MAWLAICNDGDDLRDRRPIGRGGRAARRRSELRARATSSIVEEIALASPERNRDAKPIEESLDDVVPPIGGIMKQVEEAVEPIATRSAREIPLDPIGDALRHFGARPESPHERSSIDERRRSGTVGRKIQ